MPPAVSVLMAVRDGAGTLEMCLAGLAAQTFADWEAVIVDDGSTDATAAVLGEWAAREPRLKPVRTPARGLVPALNLAAAQARGRYFLRQDADDASHPERFSAQVAALEENRSWDVVATRVTIFPEPDLGLRRYQEWINGLVDPEAIAREIWIESPLPHPTVAIRRAVFEESGGYRDMGWPEDYDLWLRLHGAGKTLAKIPEVLYAWRDSPERLSRTHSMYSAEAFRRCKAHHLRPLLEGREIWIWGAGPFGRRLARALRENGLPVDRFVDIDPLKVGRRVQGAPVEDTKILQSGPRADRMLLVCVGVHGARHLIRGELENWGHREDRDYLVVS
ncbi:MAG: glycosyltransferase [Candidatus Eisenbacteria bacterium]|nr:glycosyltransferase [Candidatus Eisenbacteria bacterium]